MVGLEWLKFLDVTKLPLRWWFVVACLSGGILIIPEDYAVTLGIEHLRNEFRPYFGLGALFSVAILGVNIVLKLWSVFSTKLRIKTKRKAALASLDRLSVYEAAILAGCYYTNSQTINVRIDNAYARSLVDKGLMKRISGSGNMMEWPHTVYDFVWDHIPILLTKFSEEELQNALHPAVDPWR